LEDAAVSAVLEDDEVDERMVRLESDVAHMRSDISDIKTDIRELRAESSASRQGLSGVGVEFAKLRDEMHTGFAELRDEMHTGLAGLRAEMHAALAELRAEIAGLRAEMHTADERLHRLIIRTSLSDRIWMLLLTGTMLTVMAHGFKWI
jgi:chromosome segregation ATPase